MTFREVQSWVVCLNSLFFFGFFYFLAADEQCRWNFCVDDGVLTTIMAFFLDTMEGNETLDLAIWPLLYVCICIVEMRHGMMIAKCLKFKFVMTSMSPSTRITWAISKGLDASGFAIWVLGLYWQFGLWFGVFVWGFFVISRKVVFVCYCSLGYAHSSKPCSGILQFIDE